MKLRRHHSLWLVVVGVLLVPSILSAQNVWTLGGRLLQSRAVATVTALDDGRVLITGGYTSASVGIPLDTVEIHSPATGASVAAPPLSEARAFHAAAKLSDGRVVVMGGMNAMGFSTRVDIFDPVTDSWQLGASMPTARALPLVAPLGSDRFLVAGGAGVEGELISVDIYDAAANAWTPAAPMLGGHLFGAVAVLQDNRVLIAGGGLTSNAEIYDPATGAFSDAGDTTVSPTQLGRVIVLPDGRAMYLGHASGAAALYDPASNSWTATALNPTAVGLSGATLLGDGRVLVAGGWDFEAGGDTTATSIYDPIGNTWSPGPAMHEPHAATAFVELHNGRLLAIGAYIGSTTAIEYFGPPNVAPTANAGPDLTAFTCDSCIGSATVNASGSTDPDGDMLTYVWSAGGVDLLTTTNPIAKVTLSSNTTLTLTVRDRFGAESSDEVGVTLVNVEDGYRATIATLQSELASCQAGGAVAGALGTLETSFREQFRDPLFELPGDTTDEELAQLIAAIKSLNYAQQQAIFRALGGARPGKTSPTP